MITYLDYDRRTKIEYNWGHIYDRSKNYILYMNTIDLNKRLNKREKWANETKKNVSDWLWLLIILCIHYFY